MEKKWKKRKKKKKKRLEQKSYPSYHSRAVSAMFQQQFRNFDVVISLDLGLGKTCDKVEWSLAFLKSIMNPKFS